MNGKILISTLGQSPGVVTGAYFMLLQEDYGQMDHVVSITTKSSYQKRCKKYIQETFDLLEAPPQFAQQIATSAKTLEDSKASQGFERFFYRRIEEYGRSYQQLYINISGGRKSMVAGAMNAVHHYLTRNPKRINDLVVFHLELLDDEFEENAKVQRLDLMSPQEQQKYLNPPAGTMGLVEIPILPYVPKPNQLLGRMFEYAVGAYLLEQEGLKVNKLRYSFDPSGWKGVKGLGEVDIDAEIQDPTAGVSLRGLRVALVRRFSLSELHTLLSDLGHNHEAVAGQDIHTYARELIRYLDHRHQLPQLVTQCQKDRPQENWKIAAALPKRLLIECKLRIDNPDKPVAAEEVRMLANKLAQTSQEEPHQTVAGWLVTNSTAVFEDAATIAQEAGIRLYHATLSTRKWQQSANWSIQTLTDIEQVY